MTGARPDALAARVSGADHESPVASESNSVVAAVATSQGTSQMSVIISINCGSHGERDGGPHLVQDRHNQVGETKHAQQHKADEVDCIPQRGDTGRCMCRWIHDI